MQTRVVHSVKAGRPQFFRAEFPVQKASSKPQLGNWLLHSLPSVHYRLTCAAVPNTHDQNSKRPGTLDPAITSTAIGANGTDAEKDSLPVDWRATGTMFLFPAVAGLLFGYDIGASSGVVASLSSPWLSGTDWGPTMTQLQSGLLVGMSLFGALAGSLTMLLLNDRFGRRAELLVAAACYIAGGLATGTAGSYEMLLAGRGLYGLGIGFAMHAAPAYIAETSPAKVRGLLVSCKEVVIVGGILLGYIISYTTADEVAGWRSMYDAAVPLAGLLGVGAAVLLPETPRWLLLKGKGRKAAAEALRRAEGQRTLQQPQYVDQQLDRIMQNLQDGASSPASSPANGSAAAAAGAGTSGSTSSEWLLLQPRYWQPLAVGCSLMLFQQVTGQPSVLYRAATILQDAGFEPGKGAASVAVLLGAFKVFMTLVAVSQVESWGRRPLLLAGCSGMVAALLVLGAAQSDWLLQAAGSSVPSGVASAASKAAASDVSLAAYVSAAALLLYVGCYQVSFGPISWLLVGELFPLKARGQAIAVASLVNFGSNFAVSTALPTLIDSLGMSSTYFLFAAVGIAAVCCMAATVPETKGKTLEQIEAMWGAREQA